MAAIPPARGLRISKPARWAGGSVARRASPDPPPSAREPIAACPGPARSGRMPPASRVVEFEGGFGMAMYLQRIGAESLPARRRWRPRDCALYALALGAGFDELAFAAESPGQLVYPTFVLSGVMAAEAESWPDPGFATGDYAPHEIVQGEQALAVHAPIRSAGAVGSRSRVAGIYDKGSGALVVLEVLASDHASGAPLFTATTSLFVRGHGGFGGERGPRAPARTTPERPADLRATWT